MDFSNSLIGLVPLWNLATQNGHSVSDYCWHNMEPGARVWRPGATTYGCMHLLHTFIDWIF